MEFNGKRPVEVYIVPTSNQTKVQADTGGCLGGSFGRGIQEVFEITITTRVLVKKNKNIEEILACIVPLKERTDRLHPQTNLKNSNVSTKVIRASEH
jgi:hypothetical protein